MPRSSSKSLAFAVLSAVLVRALPVGAQALAEDTAQPADVAVLPAYASLAARAVTAYREGRHELAIELADAALREKPPALAAATIEFNAAAACFELGRYTEAERRFARSAKLDPGSASVAWVSAALAALRAGNLKAASSYVRLVPENDPGTAERRQEIIKELAAAHAEQDAQRVSELVLAALQALGERDAARARALLDEAWPLLDRADDGARADAHYAKGLTLEQLGDLRGARAELARAAALAPEDRDVALAQADAAFEDGDDRAAESAYERALSLGLDDDDDEHARDRLATLRRLPSGAWFLLSLGGGYDTNATQSGVSRTTGVSRRQANPGSGFGSTVVSVGYDALLGERTAIGGEYSGSFLALSARPVRELSLQVHELSARATWAPFSLTRLDVRAGVALLYEGLEQIEPFTQEAFGRLRIDRRLGQTAIGRASFEARAMSGTEGREYLGGYRLDTALGAFSENNGFDWDARVGYLHNGLGIQRVLLEAGELPGCGAGCAGLVYEIPLAYGAPYARGDVMAYLGPVGLGAVARIEMRRYLDESLIIGIEESRKRREDLRLGLGGRVEIALDRKKHFALLGAYDYLTSRSNMALGDAPEHVYDYDDRQFDQHVVEFSLEVAY